MGIMRFTTRVRAPLAFTLLLGAAFAFAAPVEVPLVPGVTFVLAVANHTSPGDEAPSGNSLQGDYEMVVSINEVSADAITEAAYFDGADASGVQRRGTVRRVIDRRPGQLARTDSRFSPRRPVTGGWHHLARSIAPDVTRELVQTGATVYLVREFRRAGHDLRSVAAQRHGAGQVPGAS